MHTRNSISLTKPPMLMSYAVIPTISKACTAAFKLFWLSAGSAFNLSCILQISTLVFYHSVKETHSMAFF